MRGVRAIEGGRTGWRESGEGFSDHRSHRMPSTRDFSLHWAAPEEGHLQAAKQELGVAQGPPLANVTSEEESSFLACSQPWRAAARGGASRAVGKRGEAGRWWRE